MPASVATRETPPSEQIRSRHSWARLGVALLAILVLAELGARALAPRLPEPRIWQSVEAQDKVHQMDALARHGGADVVFVGSSLVNGAIDVPIATRQLGPGIRVYNAALSAGIPLIMEPWTLQVVLPRLHPKLLVIGVSSLDFADSSAARAFEAALRESPAGRRALGTERVLDRIDRWLTGRSDLWRYRYELRQPRIVLNAIRGRDQTPVGEYGPVQPGGRMKYRQGRPRNDGQPLGPPLEDWKLGSDSPAAIKRMIERSQAQGIKVALVDMPVTQAYVDRHPRGRRDFQSYLTALRRLGRSERALLLEHDKIRDPSLFVDEVHLSFAAGDAFTAGLARELAAQAALRPVLGDRGTRSAGSAAREHRP